MKKYAFIPCLLWLVLGLVSCNLDAGEEVQIGEEITYPDELSNKSISDALAQLKGWTGNESSMDITISGPVNQNLLLKLKEGINVLQVKVSEKQKIAADYKFILNFDFSQISGVTGFYECYFNGCPILGSVILPECFTEISKYTFSNCKNLKEIVIPENVCEIGYSAFTKSGLEKITIKSNNLVIKPKAFDSLNADFIIDNSNENKIRIANNLCGSESPFDNTNNKWYNTFHIDEEYQGEDSDFKFTYSKSGDKLFCNIEGKSEDNPVKAKVLISYAKNYDYDHVTGNFNLESPFDLSDIVDEDFIIAPKSMVSFSNSGENCMIYTGKDGVPEGKGLYYSTSLTKALNKYSSKKYLIDLSKFEMSDYNDVYDIWSSFNGGYYLYIADL